MAKVTDNRHDERMQIDIRNITPIELTPFVRTIETAFGQEMRASDIPTFKRKIDLSRLHAAFDDEDIVATAGVFPFNLTIPGAEIPAAGVTMVGVLPTHRRRGILRQMMRIQLDEARSRGESIAVLWASEDAIYQRFGYGPTANQAHIDTDPKTVRFLDDDGPQGKVRFVEVEDRMKVLPSIYDRVRAERPGMYERSHTWWETHSLLDPEHSRRGASPLLTVVLELDGKPEAYASYRVRPKWGDDAIPNGTLEVGETIGTSAVATREIWRYLFGVDLIRRVQAYYLPADFPLLLMVQESRALRFSFSEMFWLRLVDLRAALEARSYQSDGTVVLQIEDDFCPWNEGRWRLDAGAGSVTSTEDDAGLVMKTNALAGAYMGGFSFSDLARAGRVTELVPGSLTKADAMFRTDVAPWCPENF